MAALSQLERDLRTKLNKSVRTVARNIMNDLAEAGPVWGGEFRDSWEAYAPGVGAAIPGQYPYTLSDIPELPVTKREMERVTKLIIGNRASYALVAMDLVAPSEGFRYPGYEPEGDVVFRGTRPDGGRRGDVGPKLRGGSDNRSTAPLDWYTTYAQGGKMQKALERGVKAEFQA
jgi:hypothetical protein